MDEAGVFRGIRVYDDLARAKRDFVPVDGNRVRMYVCGVTVYDDCHMGHARTYVTFDVIRRYLEYRGYEVSHIQNFTDVDDKIIRRAIEEGTTEGELAERFIGEYFKVMDALHVKRATAYPRATDAVPEMIEMIEKLVRKGHAYESGGDVFFNVESFSRYGELSGTHGVEPHENASEANRNLEGGGKKREPRDFALWKGAKEGEPFWASPWGPGRPGWHIECSAMARRHLGETIDIHGGGHDLLFPHHENEIAQSEAYTGKKFANYWVHSGFVQIDGEKMAKSVGNIVPLKEMVEKYSADAVRLCFLRSHYRMPLNFSDELLDDARAGAERFRAFFDGVDSALAQRREFKPGEHPERCEYEGNREDIGAAMEAAEVKFVEAMNNDFNTPEALAAMYELVRAGNAFADEVGGGSRGACCELIRAALRRAKNKVLELGNVLGMFEPDVVAGADVCRVMLDGLVNSMLLVRKRAREGENWEISDMIRDELEKLGIGVEDRPGGTTWRLKK